MRIFVAVMIVASMALVALPAAAQSVVNGTFSSGLLAPTGATTGNLSTALTGWTYSVSATPVGNWYIGYNDKSWNQRPGGSAGGVGSIWHGNPSGKTANVTQTVTGLQAGALYNVSAWFVASLVTGYASDATLTLAVQNPDAPGWTWAATLNTPGVWTKYVLPVTASAAGKVDIRMYVTMGTQGWTAKSTPNAAWDDVTIAIVPEPGSMIALMSGLIGLAGFGIRRRR